MCRWNVRGTAVPPVDGSREGPDAETKNCSKCEYFCFALKIEWLLVDNG
jgi:hypothetical protein